jgi:hypothetical protein
MRSGRFIYEENQVGAESLDEVGSENQVDAGSRDQEDFFPKKKKTVQLS